MIKKLLCIASLAVFGTPGEASTTISFVDPVPETTSYTVNSVTFTADGGQVLYSPPHVNPSVAFCNENGLPVGGFYCLVAGLDEFVPITATLPSSANFVSVWLGDRGSDQDLLFLEAYDASNALIGSTTLLTTADDVYMHELSISAPGIASAHFGSRDPSVGGSTVYADNFTFQLSAVPEPSAWAMMLIGFTGIGFVMRRKRSSVVPC